MYYHTLSELGIIASNNLQLQSERITNEVNSFDNCGKMSVHDSLRDIHLTEKRIMDFIYELSNKVNEAGISPLISIPFISKSLNLSEEIITIILQKNRLELITTDEEDD